MTPQKYRYVVKTTQDKTLTGIITALTIEAAQKNLSKMGYIVLSVTLITEEQPLQTSKKVFSFEAVNRAGKKILGTITSQNIENAKKKLVTDHGLTILKLHEITPATPLPQEEKNAFKEEALMVIEKAEKVLASLLPYDPDYNIIFDAKEGIRQMLKMAKYDELGATLPEVLELLQTKEKTDVLEEKKEKEHEIKKGSEELMMSMKTETIDVKTTLPNAYFNTVLQELSVLSSWLLAFYAIYFVTAEVVVEKNIQIPLLDFFKNTLMSSLLFKISLAMILLHLFCKFKLKFLEDKIITGVLLGIITLLSILWTFLI